MIIGKLSDDRIASGSQIAAIMGENPWESPNDVLRRTCEAIKLDVAHLPSVDIGEKGLWGSLDENTTAIETAKRLKLKVNTEITEVVAHPSLPLQCSNDAELEGDGSAIEHNPGAGIYTFDEKPVIANGVGVLEVKNMEGTYQDWSPSHKGDLQVEAQKMCLGAKWGAVAIRYNGNHLRIYVSPVREYLVSAITSSIVDFDKRLNVFKKDGVIDWYEARSDKDANQTYAKTDDDKTPIQLSKEIAERVLELDETKACMTQLKKNVELLQKEIKDFMGCHEHAVAELENQLVQVKWGMTKGREAKFVEALEPKRSSALKVKIESTNPLE